MMMRMRMRSLLAVGAAFALLLSVAVAEAVDFTVCDNADQLGVQSIDVTPDPIVPGKDATILVSGQSSVTVEDGATMTISLEGQSFDQALCDFVDCPIPADEPYSIELSGTVPKITPTGTYSVTVQVYSEAGGEELECVQADVTISRSGRMSAGAQEMLVAQAWEQFKKDYSKTYETPEEEENRRMIFVENLELAAEWNKLEGNDIFGITQFSDIGQEEFQSLYLNHRGTGQRKDIPVRKPDLRSALPSSFDWRDVDDVVTPVKNQMQCGSCWAFSATETIESAWALDGHDLTEFSVEQIVQCDQTSWGCMGGTTESAYHYVENAGGLATEEDYPYTSKVTTGDCKKHFQVSGGDISGFEYATEPCTSGQCNRQDEDTMAANLVNNQPVSICVDASKWNLYRGGVMTSASCSSAYNRIDHCVQATGFADIDTRNGYWIVRNSWAATWGERGYIYLAYGDNTCGVADDATTVYFRK